MSKRSRKNITRITGGVGGITGVVTDTAVGTLAAKTTAVKGNLSASQQELDQLTADFNKPNFDTHLLAKALYPYISIYDYSENVQGTNKCNFIQQNNAEEAIQEMEKFPHLNMKIIECYYSGEQLKLMYDFITHGIDDVKRSLFNIVLLENKDLNVRGRQKFLERRTNGKFIGTYSNAYLKYEFILMGSQEAAHVRDEAAHVRGSVEEADGINAFSSAFCKYQTVNMDDTIINVRWCSKFYLILKGLEKLAKDTTFFDYKYTKPITPEEIDTIKQKTRKEYSDQISIADRDKTLYNMKKANTLLPSHHRVTRTILTQEQKDREFIDNYNNTVDNMKGIKLTANTDPQPHVEKDVDTVTPTIINKSAGGADRKIDGSCSVIVTDNNIDVWFNGRTKIDNKFSQDERNALERVAAADGTPVPKWVSDQTVTNMSYNIGDVLFFAGKTDGALKYPEFTITLNQADVDILSEKSNNLNTKLTSPITNGGEYKNGNTSYYLPLVYSYSENIGLAPFACYLTEKQKKYVLLHSIQATKKISRWHFKNCLDILTNDINRQDVILYNKFAPNYYKAVEKTDESLKDELENSSYSLLDLNKFMAFTIKYPHNNNNTDNKQPICVLLDPTMTEGFNAKYNPALFIIEPCNSFGDSEQVNGRILRKYGRDDVSNPKWLNNKTNKNKAQLFQKYVYQFSVTKDRTDEQNNPDWYTNQEQEQDQEQEQEQEHDQEQEQEQDQFGKASNWNNPFLSLIRNIRNKDYTEDQWLRSIKKLLTGDLTDKTDIYGFYEYRMASFKFDFVYPESYISNRIQNARDTLIDLEVNCTSRSNTINCGDEDDIIGYILKNHKKDGLVDADDYTNGIQNRLFVNSSKPTVEMVSNIIDEIDASENDEGEFTDAAAAQKKEEERAAEAAEEAKRLKFEVEAGETLLNAIVDADVDVDVEKVGQVMLNAVVDAD